MSDTQKLILLRHLFDEKIGLRRFEFYQQHLWIYYVDQYGEGHIRHYNSDGRMTILDDWHE